MNRRTPEVDAGLVAWLDEGPSTGPEEVLSGAFARARSTRQDRVWLDRIPLPTRFQTMSASIAVTAVAVLSLAVGVAIVPRAPEVAAPAPSVSPTPPATAAPLRQGSLPAGTYTVAPFAGAEWSPCDPSQEPCLEAAVDDDLRFTFTVPEGWAGAPLGSDIWLSAERNSGPSGAGFLIGRGGWLYTVPCSESGEADIPVGPTVEDFVDALVEHPLLDVSDPLDVTIGGHAGKYLELQGPADRTDCSNFQAWEQTFYAQGDSNLQHIWVIDVDGVRVVIHGSEFPETAPERSAELRAIVDSMRIERDPALAPSPSPRAADPAAAIRGWPSARPGNNPAGLYSWSPRARSWMHNAGGPVEITFEMLDEDAWAIPASDIGALDTNLDGYFTERPQRVADVRMQSWIMSVAGTRVVIVVKSYPDTAPSVLAQAETIVDSVYSEPRDTSAGFRLVFELPAGWDSG